MLKVSHISTLASSRSLQTRLAELQSELNRAQKEVGTGKLADSGLTLGARSADLVSLTSLSDRLKTISDTNTMAAGRLDAIQNALTYVNDLATDLMSTLSSGSGSGGNPEVTSNAAFAALEQATGALNTSYNGVYVFSGQNGSVPAVSDYLGGAGKAAFDSAFLTHFGFAKDDPAAQNIDPAAITNFLDTVVAPMFTGAGWTANMSSATDEGMVTRISETRTAVTSASANEDALRKMVMAAVITGEFFDSNLNESTRNAVGEYATRQISEASGALASLQGRIGVTQQRVEQASQQIGLQRDLLTAQIGDMEGVDPYEASTRLTSLLSQMEMSYTITARLNELSLIRFIG